MNEYLSRSEISPVDRAATRAPGAVTAVQPVAAGTSATGRDTMSGTDAQPSAIVDLAALDDEAAGAAEYAKVHARIADILADLRSQSTGMSIDGADAAVQSMMPAPFIFVPLPPATREAVERAADLAKRIASQASYAHAAQAHLKRGTVDQILSQVV